MPSLFISHSDKDNSIAREVAARVKAQGFDYFLDDDILPGEKWEERIHTAMRECIAVLFCATPDALQSRYAFAEIVMTRFRGIPLIPLIFAKCDLPAFITGTTQYDDFLTDRDAGYRKLFAALNLLKLKVASEWLREESPYPGLLAMEEKYAPVFFGRDTEIKAAIEALRPSAQQRRFLAIIGPSGSGKSSLARAGIIPALKRGAIPGSQNWVYVPPFTPGETPFRNLGEKLRVVNPALGGTREIETRLREDKSLLYALLDARHDDVQVVLLIDQLEEIERRTPRDEATAFLARIRETLDAPDTPLIALATLRADFVSPCLQFPDLARLLQSGTQLLGIMDRAGLRQAIMGPARVAGLQFDDGLVEEILDDTKGGDALPLMAYVLEELWKRRADSKMARAVYREVGGVAGALAQRAQAIYDTTPEEEREPLRGALIELADVNERGDFTRRRVSFDALPSDAHNALERLVAARLLTKSRDDQGVQIEVVHEALLRNWDLLIKLLDERRKSLIQRRRIELDAQEWIDRDHNPDTLYRGTVLAEALEWQRNNKSMVATTINDFLQQGLALRIREQRNSQIPRIIIGIAITIVFAVIVLSVTGQMNRLIYQPLAMDWITIPAGEFLMGSSDTEIAMVREKCTDCDVAHEQPQHAVFLDTFQINKYEVTNKQYRQCVRAGVCATTNNTQIDDPNWDDYPVVYINWGDAVTFCNWVNGRLPSEAEWEKSARGPIRDWGYTQVYPWGNQWDSEKANADLGDKGKTMRVGSFSPMGDSPYGISDTSGNVWEWVMDWYSASYYAHSPLGNPKGPETGIYRVMRGGSFFDSFVDARSTYRRYNLPSNASDDLGFRCVR